jgi:hypothetical protein
MGELKKWREQNWVRIGIDGSIKGPCGTSKNNLSKSERAATARKKKAGGAKGKQFVSNTPKAKVKFKK